jgi:hypothetical protein
MYTCLMTKKSKKKVKSKSSHLKYVSSDDELDSSDEKDEETLLNDMCKNPMERMKELLKKLEFEMSFLINKKNCSFKRERNQELKKLLKLEK